MSTSISFSRFTAKYDLADWQAIVKTDHDERRILIGFERKNKKSRHYRTKLLITPPVVLTEVVAAHRAALNSKPSPRGAP